MVKFTILGSRLHSPYEILAMPNPYKKEYTKETHDQHDSEKDYEHAFNTVFKKAIDESDIIIVYAPKGKVGLHTFKDMEYAHNQNKRIVMID
jgi:lactate dehydrogenase-like 2-hydroxyacid dehydrogenase